jgi:hypothetical protein
VADDLARYYHILGLEPDASPEAVKVAYRDCVDAWHPDRFTHSPERQARAQARLKQINDAYKQLRRSGASTRRAAADREPSPSTAAGQPSAGRAQTPGATPGASGQRADHHRATAQESRARAPEPPSEPPPAPRSWLELSRESRFTVTTLYFTFIALVIAAGCGVSLGGMYFGPLGAVCGILVSPLAGLIVAAGSAAVASTIAGRLGGIRGSLLGAAIALLVPGSVCGAVLVWSTSRAILGNTLPPVLDVLLGGVVGAGCGVGLGAWTGKAISIAMGELKEGNGS